MIIYKITNNINGVNYIGKTKNSIQYRWQQHYSNAKNNCNSKFYNAIRKYGTECWSLEILEEVQDINLLNEREQYWIAFYNTFKNGYNSTTGGEGQYELSEETKEKISKSNKNKIRSEEVRKKYCITNKGKSTPQAIKAMVVANVGKHRSLETREKIKLSNLGKTFSIEHKNKIKEKRKLQIITEETKEKMKIAQQNRRIKEALLNK